MSNLTSVSRIAHLKRKLGCHMKTPVWWYSDLNQTPIVLRAFWIKITRPSILFMAVVFNTNISTYCGKLYIRKLHSERYYELFTKENLKKIHQVVYDKPYDLVITDWIEAYCKKDPHPQKTSRFVCSAFIGYVYTQLTLLREDTDWSILYPGFFSSENPALRLRHESYLSPEELIHV